MLHCEVIRDRCSRSCQPVHVRFGPKPTEMQRCHESTLCATNGLMHRSKKYDYSITSSAICWSDAGTSSPSALAVLRLITSSNLVGCWIGRLAGFSPLRMRSTYP